MINFKNKKYHKYFYLVLCAPLKVRNERKKNLLKYKVYEYDYNFASTITL